MNQIATNQINKIIIYILGVGIFIIGWYYLYIDIITKPKDISNKNTISYTKLDKNNIADSNIYIYGYQGDILTSRGVGFLDMDSDNIITVSHNIDKSDNTYYIHDSKNNQKINIDNIYKSSGEDLSLIYSQEYLRKNVTSIWINWDFYKITDNTANSWYIYLSWQVNPWQSGSPVYCDNDVEICGIIIANNELKNQIKILLINQKTISDVKK